MVTHTRNSCSAFTHPSAHTQQWTHNTPSTHTRSSGQPFVLRCSGSSWEQCLVVVWRMERVLYIHSPTYNSAGPRLKLATFRSLVRLSSDNFPVTDPSLNTPFDNFFLPFSNLISHQKGIYFSINGGNNQNVKNKGSGMVRVGVGRVLLFQLGGIYLIIWINIIIFTQYVIIAYCFIMYYNTEVHIIATICNK